MHKSVTLLLQHYDDFAMVSADAADAFGNLSRQVVLDTLSSVCPALLPWVVPALERSHIAIWRDDRGSEHVYSCSRGLLQGEPLSTMLFVLTQDVALKTLQAELRTRDDRAVVLAYLDDVVLLVAHQHMEWAFTRYRTWMQDLGIPIQPNLDTHP